MESASQDYFKDINSKLLSLSFNQDCSCFSIGTERGFKIYETYPLNEGYEQDLNGGIQICEMLNRTNLLALVGGGTIPKYNKNKVVIWDDYQEKIDSEYKFTSSVKNVKIKKDKIFIVCEKKIFVFNLLTSQNIDSLDTLDNEKGLLAISNATDFTIIAYPILFEEKEDKGYVSIKNYKTNKCFPKQVQEDHVSYMAINYDGFLLATANEKGTILRIHSCIDGTFLQEYKRGKEKANIQYICFDKEYKYFGATSDRGTIHVWSLKNVVNKMKQGRGMALGRGGEGQRNNSCITAGDFVSIEKSDIEEIKNSGHIKTENSFAKVRMSSTIRSIFEFEFNDEIVIITYDGKYHIAKIDTKKGGDCKIILTVNLLEK